MTIVQYSMAKFKYLYVCKALTRRPSGLTTDNRHRMNARQAADGKHAGSHNQDGQQQQAHLLH